MHKILALTTINNTLPLKLAINAIRQEYGNLLEIEKVYFNDYSDPDISIAHLIDAVSKAGIILVDVRGDHRVTRELIPHIKKSEAVVIVLVGSSPEIMSLTRMGKFSAAKIFKPGPERDFDVNAYLRAKKFSDLTKKLGRFIPVGMIKDMRNWIIAQEYYGEGDPANLKNLFLFLLKNYRNESLIKKIPLPAIQPGFGMYMPGKGITENIVDYKKYIAYDAQKPDVGLLIYAGMHFHDTAPMADALYQLMKKTANVMVVFSKAEYNLEALEKYLPKADILINMQFFRMHGGPFGGSPEPTFRYLNQINAPLLLGLRSYETTLSKWEESKTGINPLELILGAVLPELDGAFEPLLLAVMQDNPDDDLGSIRQIHIIPDRIQQLANRIEKWLLLRKLKNAEKKIALITYNYPPGEDNLANAGYLDVLESMHLFYQKLKDAEYLTSEPGMHLRDYLLQQGLFNSPSYNEKKGIRVSVEKYKQWFNTLPQQVKSNVIKHWGEAPGDIMTEGNNLVLPVCFLGNIILGVQPSRGVHEDEEKAYHDKELPPHHQYLCFYFFLQHELKVNAILHFGTHGTLEFTKGKETALSSSCYPDLLIGSIPHLYYYWVGNTSESTIAKRRSLALCISHASPCLKTSGLYEDYITLEDLLRQYEESGDEHTLKAITDTASLLNLPSEPEQISKELFLIKRKMIPFGLHIIDKQWSDEEYTDYLMAVLRIDREYPSLQSILSEQKGLVWSDIKLSVQGNSIEEESKDIIEKILKNEILQGLPDGYDSFVRDIKKQANFSRESDALIKALAGQYMQPACGGDPVRDPGVYPTGRAMNAFNPTLIPTILAEKRGWVAADKLVNLFLLKNNHYPESVGVVLWAFETLKTGGDTISIILSLMGLKMKQKKNVWFREFETIPLEELKRPRIDVMVTICGIFRDTLGTHLELLDRAFEWVANLDEPDDLNYIRKHYRERANNGDPMALARIYGPSPTEYATTMRTLIETGSWEKESELVESYDSSMNYAYHKGKIIRAPEAFKSTASKVELVTQERDNHEYEVTDLDHYYEFMGGLARSIKEKRGKETEILLVDSTDDEVVVEDATENITRASRTRVLNPKWLEGMLKHEYHGAAKIKDRVEYLMALAATTGKVENWIFDQVADKLIFNEEMHEKMLENNPYATNKVENLLLETYNRGYWDTSDERISKIKDILLKTDSGIESVT